MPAEASVVSRWSLWELAEASAVSAVGRLPVAAGGATALSRPMGPRFLQPGGNPSPGCDSPLPLAGEGEVHEEQVEGDDDGRDEETCDTQGAIVDVVAHDLTVCGQAHEWDDREGDAE